MGEGRGGQVRTFGTRIGPGMTQVHELTILDRQGLAGLLDAESAADAAPLYFALHHPPERTRLLGYGPDPARPTGFLAVAHTGLDLFRPLLIPFVNGPEAFGALMGAALASGMGGVLRIPAEQIPWIDGKFNIGQAEVSQVLRLDPSAYEPVLNVLVSESRSPDGAPRYEARGADGTHAAAGLNWYGNPFAEVYLQADSRSRTRKMSVSVLSAMVGRLLGERRIPLYLVRELDMSARTEALTLGFRPTGGRVAVAEITATGSEALSEA